jgi:tRNA wybutosine-synthesizing protein 2
VSDERTDGSQLAAVVAKPDAKDAIAALREEGVYDDTRRVEPHDDEMVTLPVTDRPTETAVRDVVETDLPRRERTLRDLLRAEGWDDDDLDRVPSSWAVVGSVVLADFEGCPDPEAVGEALLALHGKADTVLARRGIEGTTREPEVTVVAGAGDTETVHTEHGTRYAMDLAEVMFSPGNQTERSGMADRVSADERVFDMFAGIGYFTLPMARAGVEVLAAEVRPESYRFLVENCVLNGVQDRVEAYRADCADVAVDDPVDRVVMGHYEAHERLDSAIAALRPGGTLHLHEATPTAELWGRPVGRLETAASRADRDVAVLGRRVLKGYGAGVEHVVVDARVG